MKILFSIASILLAVIVLSQAQIEEPAKAGKIIPVAEWPKVISTESKLICGPTKEDCIKAGYRLLPAKPATPAGKRIVSETIVQDDKDAAACKYEIVYEDIPATPTPIPYATPKVTNVPSSRVQFQFSTNGQYRGVVWLDAPVTNGAGKE